ncbi:MAG: hypothetical protein LRZ84_10425 [Desertifilum sp.]|nr:hypothetical protein [Desertifilum sp.]
MSQQPNLLESAKQGNPKAIATLLSHTCNTKGVHISVTRHSEKLNITLRLDKPLDQQILVSMIHQDLIKLKIRSIKFVKIKGVSRESNAVLWSQNIEIPANSPVSKDNYCVEKLPNLTKQVKSRESQGLGSGFVEFGKAVIGISLLGLYKVISHKIFEENIENFIFNECPYFSKYKNIEFVEVRYKPYVKPLSIFLAKLLIDDPDNILIEVTVVRDRGVEYYLIITSHYLILINSQSLREFTRYSSYRYFLERQENWIIYYIDIKKIISARNGISVHYYQDDKLKYRDLYFTSFITYKSPKILADIFSPLVKVEQKNSIGMSFLFTFVILIILILFIFIYTTSA